MSGSYIYDMVDMVWCGLEMIEINNFCFALTIVTNYSSSRLLMPSWNISGLLDLYRAHMSLANRFTSIEFAWFNFGVSSSVIKECLGYNVKLLSQFLKTSQKSS